MSTEPNSQGNLFELLNTAILVFDDDSSPFLLDQLNLFSRYYQILSEDATSVNKQPKQRRSEKQRIRHILTDIFLVAGPEAFVLCTIAVPIQRLEKEKSEAFIPELRKWWKSAKVPRGFILAAKDICRRYSISVLISSLVTQITSIDTGTNGGRKRKRVEIDNQAPQHTNWNTLNNLPGLPGTNSDVLEEVSPVSECFPSLAYSYY
jgi:hypothetical protein